LLSCSQDDRIRLNGLAAGTGSAPGYLTPIWGRRGFEPPTTPHRGSHRVKEAARS
jgi:hypothetical protein